MFNSLVSLKSSTYETLGWQTIKDLNLSDVFELLDAESDHQEKVIFSLCQDKETIEYRQAMMRDFIAMPKLLEELDQHLERFGRFRHQIDNELKKASRLYYLIELLKIVEASVSCLEELYQSLCYYKIRAKGLLDLKRDVEQMLETPKFKKMKADMKEIRYIFSQIKSVEVSINMNSGMRPYEAQVTQVNDHRYRFPKAFRHVSDALNVTDSFLGRRIRNYIPIFPVEKMHMDLLEEIEYALRDHHDILRTFLNNYSRVDATPFMRLHEEVSFYRAGYKMIRVMVKKPLSMCWPSIRASQERSMVVEGAYNLTLAKEMAKEGSLDHLIRNDIRMDDASGMMILTGSNRGGKTTYTQMVGQVQVLTQLGLPVPANSAIVSIVDRVVTHFPRLELESIDHGRFGKECLMFKAFYDAVTDRSLVLMNESFAGTSHMESLEVAEGAIRALKAKRVRTVYNTHLHELGAKVEGYNKAIENDCLMSSYIVGDIKSDQVYKVYEAPPRGYSQAYEIAKAFGVTYEQLTGHMDKEEAAQ